MTNGETHPAHYVGASNEARDNIDLYETPAKVTNALVGALPDGARSLFDISESWRIWEPACGRGAISSVLLENGLSVVSTDKFDHGYMENESRGSADFFDDASRVYAHGLNTIITNPPYQVKQGGRTIRVEDWIERCFAYPEIERAILLLKTTAIAGIARSKVMEKHLVHVWQFEERVAMLKNGVPQANMIDFAWMMFWRERPSYLYPTVSWITTREK